MFRWHVPGDSQRGLMSTVVPLLSVPGHPDVKISEEKGPALAIRGEVRRMNNASE